MSRKVRIGIDVGGTFTDAVAIDNETYEIIAKKKISTTHHEGVAKGIIQIVKEMLVENNIKPSEVTFIAHGTTQATNALLEGDVAKVGIIGLGKGSELRTVRKETNIKDIELANNKYLKSFSEVIDEQELDETKTQLAIESLMNKGSEVIVVSGAYSVDDPSNEQFVQSIVDKNRLLSTAGHEISELYGLKMRTRTAVVNGSLIPKMIVTANMTEEAVKGLEIDSELMVMRADGGVMSVDEVRKRPILTMLSGLAAGVAGALMYEKITDGIFFEIGGTSTDISVIKNGKVMVKYAQVGGHKTYLQSLDVRTLAIAGGTMIRVNDSKMIDVGPRSSHIAGIEYECFTEFNNPAELQIDTISPKDDDPQDYAIIKDTENQYAYTLCGAANYLGYVSENNYAYGNQESTKLSWGLLGESLRITGEEAAQQAIDLAVKKLRVIVDDLVSEYELDLNTLTLVSGGGSAEILIEALANSYETKVSWKVAKNAPYISTIGVALAMVRETLERSVTNPDDEDIRRIRTDVIEKIVKSGALESTVEVNIEIDSERNILRAIATGSTELRSKDLSASQLTNEEYELKAKELLDVSDVSLVSSKDRWSVYESIQKQKKLFGLFSSKQRKIIVFDREGVARFRNDNAHYYIFTKNTVNDFFDFVHDHTVFSDANATIPYVHLFYKEKNIDLSGIQNVDQMSSIISEEIKDLEEDYPIISVVYNS